MGAAAGGRPVQLPRTTLLDVGPFVLTGAPTPSGDAADAYCPRRTILDDILVRAAAEAGAELRVKFSVQELVTDDGQVTGIRGRAVDGSVVTEKARIVIGADRMNSLVARNVDPPTYNAYPTLTCAYYSYWSGVDLQGVELYSRAGQAIITAPTNDGQVFMIVYWPSAEFHRVRSDIEGNFLQALHLAPQLAERIWNGTRTERFRGTGHLPNFFRRPHGDGWALVGDAGYHKDPILALGITDAFRDAQLLSDALDAGLSGRQPLASALADYELRRNELAPPGYENTIQFASLEPPPPEMQQLMAALVHDQEQTNRFFGAFLGTVPASEFFAPDNIAKIMGEHPPPSGEAAANG